MVLARPLLRVLRQLDKRSCFFRRNHSPWKYPDSSIARHSFLVFLSIDSSPPAQHQLSVFTDSFIQTRRPLWREELACFHRDQRRPQIHVRAEAASGGNTGFHSEELRWESEVRVTFVLPMSTVKSAPLVGNSLKGCQK